MANQKVLREAGKRSSLTPFPVEGSDDLMESGAIYDALINPYDTRGKLMHFYKKLLNGFSYASGINAQRGDIHLRMGIFGDSVGGDVVLPIYHRLRNMFGTGGSAFGQPQVTGGAVTRADGNTTTYWFNGNWHEINGAGSLTFLAAGARMSCSVLKIYYIKEPGAGTFQVQVDSGSGYVDEGSVVDTNDATLQSGILTITKGSGNYSIRINQVSGNVKIIMCVGLNELVGQDSLFFINLNVGGLGWNKANLTPRAITNPVFADLKLDLATIMFKEGGDVYTNFRPWFLDYKIASPETDWVLIASGPQSSQVEMYKQDNSDLKRIALETNTFFFDGDHPLIDYPFLVSLGLGGDGVHLDKIAGAYIGGMLWRALGVDSFALIGQPFGTDKSGYARMNDNKGIAFKGTANPVANAMSIECSGSGDVVLRSSRWLDFRNMAGTQLFMVNNSGDIQVYTRLTTFKPSASGPAWICGAATLVNGVATVASTAVTANSLIMLTLNTPNGTICVHYAALAADRQTGVQFQIKSLDASKNVVATDNSQVNWLIMN